MARFELRTYQQEAIEFARAALKDGKKRVLIIAPTGSGKSLLAGKIAALAAEKTRVLVLCSQSHLINQNLEKFVSFTDVPAGIYCAQLGRKDTSEQVIFASRDSLGRNPGAAGKFGLLIVDEAHQLDIREESMYQRIVKEQEHSLVVGMTGTPWRLSGGKIWGKDRFFESVCYNISMNTLRKEGFLVPYRFPSVETKINTEGIKKSHGDFKIAELERVSSNQAVIAGSIMEWMIHAHELKASMFFCVTRNHAQKVLDELKKHIQEEEIVYVDGETKEREPIFEDIRAGKYKAIVSIGALTTGFDAPIVDCIVMLRATQSTSLFVQMCGRGLRPYQDKKDLLILDFADNFKRFKTLETPLVSNLGLQERLLSSDPSEKKKDCPECCAEISLYARECGFCGEIFKLNHSKSAHRAGDLDTPVRMKVHGVKIEPIRHRTTLEHGYKLIWSVTLDNRNRVFEEYFYIERPGWNHRFVKRRHQMQAKIIFVTATIVNGKFIRPVEIETENTVVEI